MQNTTKKNYENKTTSAMCVNKTIRKINIPTTTWTFKPQYSTVCLDEVPQIYPFLLHDDDDGLEHYIVVKVIKIEIIFF